MENAKENIKNYNNLKHLTQTRNFPKRRNDSITAHFLATAKATAFFNLPSFFLFPGKPFYQNEDQPEESSGFLDGNNIQIGSPARSSPHSQGSDNGERFSRKVFVGGLPPDIDEGE